MAVVRQPNFYYHLTTVEGCDLPNFATLIILIQEGTSYDDQQFTRVNHMIKILFVCHGNICRSPMAEFVMKDMVRKAGLETRFVIESKAARRDELGNDTHYGTRAKLRQMGIPFAKRRATLLSKADYAAYDYLVAMDAENVHDMLRLFGGDPEKKITMLLQFAGENREVADPWYTGNFDETYEDVVKGCKGLLEAVK